MNITIIGAGYVGLVTGACFAEMGNTVTCVDVNVKKIENLSRGVISIYEPGLEEMVKRAINEGRIRFTGNIEEALSRSSICFIAVDTPMDHDGNADLTNVLAAARDIGLYMAHDMLVVDKSTVPVGTAYKVRDTILNELGKRDVSFQCKIVSNPEFLKEGAAIADFMSPDRVVIGTADNDSAELMRELYAPFIRTSDRFVVMDICSAEMTKYAANAMLALRISFMNEMAQICEAIGADVNKVRLGIGSDSRIGYSYLFAGCGYGGSCFPKDIHALIQTARDNGCTADILKQVEAVNQRQKRLLADKVVRLFGDNLIGKRFAVWGLAFKPNTDDMREAPSVAIIRELLSHGAIVTAFDPKAMEAAREQYLGDSIRYARNKYTALNHADALLLITEWKEFRSPDFDEMKLRMKNHIIIDGRNQYNADYLKKMGFEYYQIGVRNRDDRD